VTRTVVIAEIGVNHDGSLDKALELVDIAAHAGADIVKFQTFEVAEIVTAAAPQAAYQRERAPAGSQQEMLSALMLDRDAHGVLAERCTARGVEFLSTAFDVHSLGWLVELGIRRVKVPSGELTNGPLLLAFARAGLPLVVSTGMADIGEVERALAVIAYGRRHPEGVPTGADLDEAYGAAVRDGSLAAAVTLLHCTSSYPTLPEDANLAAMDTLRGFGLPVGYSDHTLGTAVSLAAVAWGAVILEKHVTLDRSAPGPDHAASLEPAELQRLVADVRAVEAARGTSVKYPTTSELDTRRVARRSIVAARPIASGEPFDVDNLAVLRPGTGRSPMDLWDLLGRPASRAYGPHEPIDATE
jgi:N-acetylneuraminate synthase